MTKCNLFSVVLAAALFLGGAVRAGADGTPFEAGETIHYTITQFGFKAGDAVLAFKGAAFLDGQRYLLVILTSNGLGFSDEERIYLDPVTYLPFKVMRDLDIRVVGIRERSQIMEEYSQQDGLVRITKTSEGKTTVTNIHKTPPVENIYGFLYRLRLKSAVQPDMGFDLHLPTVDVRLQGVRVVKDFHAAGQVFEPVLLQSVPDKYSIWLDAGPRHFPLRIAGALGVANAVMIMTAVDDGKAGVR